MNASWYSDTVDDHSLLRSLHQHIDYRLLTVLLPPSAKMHDEDGSAVNGLAQDFTTSGRPLAKSTPTDSVTASTERAPSLCWPTHIGLYWRRSARIRTEKACWKLQRELPRRWFTSPKATLKMSQVTNDELYHERLYLLWHFTDYKLAEQVYNLWNESINDCRAIIVLACTAATL